MANYSIKQIAYAGKSSCLAPYPSTDDATGKLEPSNILGSKDSASDFSSYGRAPYQQIILNNKYIAKTSLVPQDFTQVFLEDIVYYLKLRIPRNSTYDLDFALLLVPEFGNAGDLDQLEYQFIKYIHVPKINIDGAGESVVVLYERPKFYALENSEKIFEDSLGHPFSATDSSVIGYDYLEKDIQVAIALKEDWDESGTKPASPAGEYHLNKLYYTEKTNGSYVYWEVSMVGGSYQWHEAGDYMLDGTLAPIGRATAVLSHSWATHDTDAVLPYELIFKPRTSGMYKLYLYLIPNARDNDITWLYTNTVTQQSTQFYGRHIDLNSLEVECYQMINLLGEVEPRRIGIWGRSELMFTINGEELRIPPSGYYELQDFPIKYFGVAAEDNRDQFTVDIQY